MLGSRGRGSPGYDTSFRDFGANFKNSKRIRPNDKGDPYLLEAAKRPRAILHAGTCTGTNRLEFVGQFSPRSDKKSLPEPGTIPIAPTPNRCTVIK
jgi:hypothetical protein